MFVYELSGSRFESSCRCAVLSKEEIRIVFDFFHCNTLFMRFRTDKFGMFRVEISSYDYIVHRALYVIYRSSHPEVFLGKGILKICSKFTGEHICRSVISIKLQSNFIEIPLRRGCFPVNLLYIFRKLFPKNIFGRLLLYLIEQTGRT